MTFVLEKLTIFRWQKPLMTTSCFVAKIVIHRVTHNKAFATRLREYGYTTKKLKDGQHLYFSMKNTVVTNEQQPDNQQPYQQQQPDNPQSDRQSILNLLRQHDQAYLREVGYGIMVKISHLFRLS